MCPPIQLHQLQPSPLAIIITLPILSVCPGPGHFILAKSTHKTNRNRFHFIQRWEQCSCKFTHWHRILFAQDRWFLVWRLLCNWTGWLGAGNDHQPVERESERARTSQSIQKHKHLLDGGEWGEWERGMRMMLDSCDIKYVCMRCDYTCFLARFAAR